MPNPKANKPLTLEQIKADAMSMGIPARALLDMIYSGGRSALATTVGMPADIANTAIGVHRMANDIRRGKFQGYEPGSIPGGSEDIKGLIPDIAKDPNSNLNVMAGTAGDFTVLPGVGTAAVKGARTIGQEIADRVATGQKLMPGPFSEPQMAMHVVKPKGGNWLKNNVEKSLSTLKRNLTPTAEDKEWLINHRADWEAKPPSEERTRVLNSIDRDMAINAKNEALDNWIEKNLTNYVKKDMATPEDPVRKLAEKGILHMNPYGTEATSSTMRKRSELGYPAQGLANSELAKFWERQSDASIDPYPAGSYKHGAMDESLLENNPWLKNVPDETMINSGKGLARGLGFDHILDVLGEDLNTGRLHPDKLKNISMEQAVRRTYEYDQDMAKKMAETAIKQTEGFPVVKEYPSGHKWIELTLPNKGEHLLTDLDKRIIQQREVDNPVPQELMDKTLDQRAYEKLSDALKYEGDTMGHCVGGYCPDVSQGKTRIFSLRDSRGEPHVTIEVKPKGILSDEDFGANDRRIVEGVGDFGERGYRTTDNRFFEGYADAVDHEKKIQKLTEQELQELPEIHQIKGKGNGAPADKYIPMVQDFQRTTRFPIKGDLQNSGFVDTHPELKKLGESIGLKVPDYLTEDEENVLRQQVDPYIESMVKNANDFLDTHPAFEPYRQATKEFNDALYKEISTNEPVYTKDQMKELERRSVQSIHPEFPYDFREIKKVLNNPEEHGEGDPLKTQLYHLGKIDELRNKVGDVSAQEPIKHSLEQIQEHSFQPATSDEAQKHFSNGHYVYGLHEQSDEPHLLRSANEVNAYTPDQIAVVPKHIEPEPEGMADGGQPQHQGFINPSIKLANGQVTLNPMEFMPNYKVGGKVHVADDLDMMRHEVHMKNGGESGSQWMQEMREKIASQPQLGMIESLANNAQGLANTIGSMANLGNRRGNLYKFALNPQAYLSNMKAPSAEELASAFNPAHIGEFAGAIKPVNSGTAKLFSKLDQVAGELPRAKGTGAEFLNELVKKPGVKKAEIADRNLDEIKQLPKMSKEEFQSTLRRYPTPQVFKDIKTHKPFFVNKISGVDGYKIDDFNDVPLTSMEFEDPRDAVEWGVKNIKPKYEIGANGMELKLPGGDNYQEHLYRIPSKGFYDPDVFKSNHWDEPNVLAHARMVDRMTPEGKKILHIEEIQSDWHKQGRKKGYRGDQKKIDWNDPEYVTARDRAMELNNEFNKNSHRPDRQAEIQPLMDEANALVRSISDRNNKIGNLVPDAPFKKNWEEMVSKDLLTHAINNGYDGIALTPGAIQADRYSLAKHIDSITLVPNFYPNENLPYYFKAFDKQGNRVAEDAVNEEKLQEYIGKEPAQQLLSSPANPVGVRMISGANIVTGGKGMKSAYDRRIPNIFNDIGKPYGVEMKLNELPVINSAKHFSEENPSGGFNVMDDKNNIVAQHPTIDEANAKVKELNSTPLHYMEFTPEMKQGITSEGLPLYKRGGRVHVADDVDMMRHELMTHPVRRFDEGGQDGRPYIGNPNIEAQGIKATVVAEARPSSITEKIQQFGNMLKDHYNRIVSDPVKYGEDLANKAQDDLDEVRSLHNQAFANPERPFQITDTDAFSKLTDKYMGSALSFAPAGITKIAGLKPIEALFPGRTLESLKPHEKTALTKYTKTLEIPAVRRREEARLTGTGTIKQPSLQLIPKQGVDPQSLLNKYIVPVLWDTSEAGNAISQIEGIPLTKGVKDPTAVISETQGGTDYPRILENINQGIAGASMKGAAASKVANLNEFANLGDTVGMVFDMSPEGINFSHHIVEPYIGMLNYLNPSKKAFNEFRSVIKNKPIESPPKSGNFIYPFKSFPGLDSPNIRDLIANGTDEYSAGNLRKAIAETANTAYFENMGFPKWEDIYKNVSRPNALTGMGSTIFSVKPNSTIMTPNFVHGSYNYGIPGIYEGSGLINAKGEIVGAPDYMMLPKEFAKRQALNKTIPNIRTSLFKAHHGEKFDQEALDNLMKYLGYKDGGKVHMGGGGLITAGLEKMLTETPELANVIRGLYKAQSPELGPLLNKLQDPTRQAVVPMPNRWFKEPEKHPHVQPLVEKVLSANNMTRDQFHSGAFVDPKTGLILDKQIHKDVGVAIDPITNRPIMTTGGVTGLDELDKNLGSITDSNLLKQGKFKPISGDPILNDLGFISTIEKGNQGHWYGLGMDYQTPTILNNNMKMDNPTLRPRSRGDVFGVGDVVGQMKITNNGPTHDVYEKLMVVPQGSDINGVKLSKKKGGKVHISNDPNMMRQELMSRG